MVKPTSRNDGETIEAGNARLSEQSGKDIAGYATNTMRSEDLYFYLEDVLPGILINTTYIKGVVITKDEFQLRCKVADRASHDSE